VLNKKCLLVFGTRPEAIKLSPIVSQIHFREDQGLKAVVCVTGQHRELLDEVLKTFSIQPDYDLNIMRRGQSLSDITCRVLQGLENVLMSEKPDLILVQGDTTTVMAASLAAYYHKIPLGHVEAGLRSRDKFQPYPEEINRRLTSILADLHFSPTRSAAANLLSEGVRPDSIFITGNTVVDALLEVTRRPYEFQDPRMASLSGRMILITAHRRESFGDGLASICRAVRALAARYPEIAFVYSVHPNPNVREAVLSGLNDRTNVILLDPLPYVAFSHLMKRSAIILSDSGGIQEEAPSLHKPLLILRDVTERPEVLEVGAGLLVGTSAEKIIAETTRLLEDPEHYQRFASAPNPFGDGQASRRIVDVLVSHFGLVNHHNLLNMAA
jgi:UDP-N-acetylglucosamine 2-epimerase (non-hydrolysing)